MAVPNPARFGPESLALRSRILRTYVPDLSHPGYLDFCLRVQERFGCSDVIHIGDEVDNHAISYHEHDPDGLSAGSEAELHLSPVDHLSCPAP